MIIVFGYKRISRRRTPYIKWQTISLGAVQVVPLFLLPYIVLPYLGHNGFFDAGWARGVADALFPQVTYDHGREYWRAFGLVLAWPLFVWNVFSGEPMWWWLGIPIFILSLIFMGLLLINLGLDEIANPRLRKATE